MGKKYRKSKFFVVLSLCLATFNTHAQYYSTGTEPTRTHWRQIKTDNFTVIYPEHFDSVAQSYTKKLEGVYDACGKGLRHQPERIPVVLHPYSNVSNASVILCPKQMDVYSICSQTQHPQEWYENLSMHEFRHVVQMDKLNKGLLGGLYTLFGEQAIGAATGVYVPRWLLEGDAVCTETALSSSGRGRQAEFSMGLRAQLYEKGAYSYSKAYFGSYKDFVPNYYVMGYYLLSNSRREYGQGLEADILDRVAEHPLSIRPVNKAVKRRTGMSRRKWYASIFEQQANEWKLTHDREIQTVYDTISRRNNVYTNYTNGFQYNDSVYFAERSGLDKISQLVKIENGFEAVVANTGFKPSGERIQSNGKSIVWSETCFDVRWEQKQRSYIYIYDIELEDLSRIKTKRHVFAPAISPSNERIVVAEIDEYGNNFLTIYEKSSKKVIKQISSPDHDAVISPSWNETGEKIVFVGLNSQGKRLVEFDVAEETFTELLPYSTEDYSTPTYWKEYVLYSSSYSGVDNIYAVQKDTRSVSRITVGDFGCKYPSATDSTLVFSNYTADGFQLGKIHINPNKWHDIKVVKKENYNLAQMMTNQEGGPVDFSSLKDTVYSSEEYNKFMHSIHIHSWMPFCMDYQDGEVDEWGLGFQLLSQNSLGTLVSKFGYKIKPQSGLRHGFIDLTYRGWFPVFQLGYKNGKHKFSYDDASYPDEYVTYKTEDIFLRMYLPFNFSSHSYYRYLVLNSQLEYMAYVMDKFNSTDYAQSQSREFYSNGYFLRNITFSNLRKTSTQELNSRFGQQITLGYVNVPFNVSKKYERYVYGTSSFYFPGIKRSHSFNVYAAAEWNEKVSEYNFMSQINMPRGYLNTIQGNKETVSLKVNYAFPMFYPDWECGDFLYLKRIRCNAFYDYAQSIRSETINKYVSYGAEIVADFHFLNFVVPINSGVRVSYLPKNNQMATEFLFSVNFDDI